MTNLWDHFYLGMSEFIAEKSKDTTTKVGAVLIDEKNRVVSVGFNGFPRGTSDDPELYNNRDEKLRRVIHAELNAIIFADRPGETLYVTHHPCSQCMAAAIQFGIKRIKFIDRTLSSRWNDSIKSAKNMAEESGVIITSYRKTSGGTYEESCLAQSNEDEDETKGKVDC